ncbi:MAG: 50S ribosomal protein L29 [Kiritimatiellae bacterium]|nr:50S ribosomal protein L29 [Kiritimatiellia bacterium]
MKTSKIREMTDEELDQLYRDTRKEIFNLRMQKATGQLENPLRLRGVRRDVARIKTVLNERRGSAV